MRERKTVSEMIAEAVWRFGITGLALCGASFALGTVKPFPLGVAMLSFAMFVLGGWLELAR